MYQERLTGVFKKKTGFSDSSPRIEQPIPFVGDMYGKSEVVISLQKIDNLLTEMMNVNHYLGKAGSFQL